METLAVRKNINLCIEFGFEKPFVIFVLQSNQNANLSIHLYTVFVIH